MNKNTTKLFLFGLLICSLTFLGCEKKLEELKREFSKKDVYIEQIEDVEIFYSDSAVVRMKIKAPFLLNFIESNKEKKEFPKGIQVEFFNENGHVTSTLNAKYAINYERENKIVIQKDVVVKSVNNETLETDELIWDEAKKQLYTDKWVKVKTPDELIYGYGFTSNQEFTQWQINKVNGRFTVDNMRNDF